MAGEQRFENEAEFEEGLAHLVDMLELSDPRRTPAAQGSFEAWRDRCLEAIEHLEATREKAAHPAARAHVDAAMSRIRGMLPGPQDPTST